MKKKDKYKPQGRLPKSREEALANPVIYTYNEKESEKAFKRGDIEWMRWDLSRPQSLEFDFGIQIKTPIASGELILSVD